MTKKEFFDTLKKELKNNNITDNDEIEEILSQYEEHFYYKLEEGCTEEEICKELSSPIDIAKEYNKSTKEVNKYEKSTKIFGISMLSIPVMFIYILMWASVVVIGAFSLVSLVTGFCLVTTLNIANLIPSIPYFPSLILGIACMGLAKLSTMGTIYLSLYIVQWTKVYIRWCKNLIYNFRYPSISKHPKLSKKLSSILKLISIISLIVFVSCFAISYIVMCIMANAFEFWHVWNWFV